MNEEPFAPEPAPGPRGRSLLIGGLAFLGGIAVTAGAYQLTGLRNDAISGIGAAPVAPAPAPTSAPTLPAGTDIATLNAREQALAGRLDQLELRLRDIDGSARNAAGQASRAEQMLLAAAVRRAVERGTPLGPLQLQLARRFSEDHAEAVATLTRAAADPVRLEDLRLALDAIGPRLAAGTADSLWDRARRMLTDLVVLRQADSPSPRPSDRLRRARRMLVEGQVEAALAEVAHMPGAADAESWVAAARRYVEARAALNEIEQAAVTAPAPAPAAPAAAAQI